MDLYSFCDGDPVNDFDPDGRLSKGFYQGLQFGSPPADSSLSFQAGYGLGIANDLSQFFNSFGQSSQQSQPFTGEHIWDIYDNPYLNRQADLRHAQEFQQEAALELHLVNSTFLAVPNAVGNGINQAENPNLDPLERWGGALTAFGNTILAFVPFVAAEESTAATAVEDTVGTTAANEGGLVIGRGKTLSKPGTLNPGEYKLSWPPSGTVASEWKINSGLLRKEMAKGKPIRDASIGDTGGMYLNAERNLLRDRGWTFDANTGNWIPPTH